MTHDPQAKARRESFIEAARPLIKWMAENVHPHHATIVTSIGAELLQGEIVSGEILDYLKD